MKIYSATPASLEAAVAAFAAALGKKVKVELRGFEILFQTPAIQPVLSNALQTLIFNMLFHGIEDPGDRLTAGKQAYGNIRISISENFSGVMVKLFDDGRGLEPVRLRALRELDFIRKQLRTMGGEVSVKSRRGKFCEFIIQLPIFRGRDVMIRDELSRSQANYLQ